MSSLESEKLGLIKRLNEALVDLDRLNQEKGELNNKLISIFKFNRDVERHTLRSDDLVTVVDESLKEELRQEKQSGVCMREQLKYSEVERYRIRDAVEAAEASKGEVESVKSELQEVYAHREKDFSALKIEYDDTVERVRAYQKEVDELRQLCIALSELISGHKNDLNLSNGGRISLRDQFHNLEMKYGRAVE